MIELISNCLLLNLLISIKAEVSSVLIVAGTRRNKSNGSACVYKDGQSSMRIWHVILVQMEWLKTWIFGEMVEV